MIFRLFFLLFAVLAAFCEGKPPPLTPKDARIKTEEILKAHVTYHALTPELIARTLLNYLDDIDPTKTYLLDYEIVKWTNPSEELLNKTLESYKKENFNSILIIPFY